MKERRKHQRYELKDKCIVRHAETIGSLTNLSLSGLSCQCLDNGRHSPDKCRKVDLLCFDNSLWVRELALEVVATEKIPGEFLSDFWIRKCRARFANLRAEQADLLESLILTHATQ